MSGTDTRQAPEQSPPTPRGGVRPDGPNRSTGAARHVDLYRHETDPAAERREQARQARTLGLGFLVVFGLVLPLVSFALNGLFSGTGVAHVPADAPFVTRARGGDLAFAEAPALALEVNAADPRQAYTHPGTTPVRVIDRAGEEADDSGEEDLRGLVGLRVAVAGRVLGTVYGEGGEGMTATALHWPPSGEAEARSPFAYCWEHAQIADVVPTRYLVYVGGALGLIGLVAPVLLVPFYKFWMAAVAAPLGWLNTRLILGLTWFLMFTPLAVVFWVRRKLSPDKDELTRAPNPPDRSYWRDKKKRSPKHYEMRF